VNLTIIDGQKLHHGVFVMSLFKPDQVSLTMTGFTIRQGFGSGIKSRPADDSYFGYGGGLFAEHVGALVLKQMYFEANLARGEDRGSGIGGSAAGGAVSLRNVASATFDHVFFADNQAIAGSGNVRGGYSVGGALFTYKSRLTGTYLVFEDNQSLAGHANGSGIAGDSSRGDALGGAASFQEESVINLRYVVARNNRAVGGNARQDAGGAFGGAFKAEHATVSISDSEISFNQARGGDAFNSWIANGGGMEAINSTVSLDRVELIGNQAIGGSGAGGYRGGANGGALNSSRTSGANNVGRMTLVNCIVADNALISGAGNDQRGAGGGGALYGYNSTIEVDHTTFARNSSGVLSWGTAFLMLENNTEPGRSETVFTVRNSIVSDHYDTDGNGAKDRLLIATGGTGAEIRFDGGLKWNNRGDIVGNITGWNTLLVGDPGFIGPGLDMHDYHIGPASAARDRSTGSIIQDIDRTARDATPDFGADEYVVTSLLAVSQVHVTANSVYLSWTPAPGLAGQVQRYLLSHSWGVTAATTQSDQLIDVGQATSYRFEGLPGHTLHTLNIIAEGKDGSIVTSLSAGTYLTSDTGVNLPYVRR
jgi:hypothetical protein